MLSTRVMLIGSAMVLDGVVRLGGSNRPRRMAVTRFDEVLQWGHVAEGCALQVGPWEATLV